MGYRFQSTSDYVWVVIDVVLVLFGLLLFFGVFEIPPLPFWLAWALALAGIVMLSVPGLATKFLGVIVMLVGLYLVLRNLDVIELAWLQYGLGGLLILVGVVNLVRGSSGGSSHSDETPVT